MRHRDVPGEAPREGWPWFAVKHAGNTYALRLRGGPRERSALAEWVQESRSRVAQNAAEIAERAKADDADGATLLEEARAAHKAAAEVHEATCGFVIAWAWADPDTALDAREDYDAARFAGPGDAKARCGLATVDELLAAGWSWEAVEDVAAHLIGNLRHGIVSRREVVEIAPFSVASGEG